MTEKKIPVTKKKKQQNPTEKPLLTLKEPGLYHNFNGRKILLKTLS